MKITKAAAGYEKAPGVGGCDVGPNPCANFRNGSCLVVEGDIARHACCNEYTPVPKEPDEDHRLSKEEAGYVEAPGHWQFVCNDCTMFRVMQTQQGCTFSCTAVSGDIRPEDVCLELWSPGKDHGCITRKGKTIDP